MAETEKLLIWVGGSKSGIATPKEDMDIIRARLKVAEALAKELRHGKAHD
jgi:hypothetical protein